MNVNGRWRSEDIGRVMNSLSELGVGTFFAKGGLMPRTVFIKKPADEIAEYLQEQGILLHVYADRYNMAPPVVGHRS